MESSNFNLDQSISTHISLIASQGTLTGADTVELTGHLYDAVEQLQKEGLSEEEAFIIACKRLGNAAVITEEYSKVNPSLNTNIIWSYLFIGFNLLFTVPSLILIGILFLYFLVYHRFPDSNVSSVIVTVFHLLFVGFIWYIVSLKTLISHYIERQVRINPLRAVSISFIPLILLFIVRISSIRLNLNQYLNYPVYKFHSTFTEFTFYLAALSVVAGVASLIFSIKQPEKITLKALFEMPSSSFLITLGILVELIGATTRVWRTDSIYISALLFGIPYMYFSYLITRYNKVNFKYLLIFSFFGIIMETAVGINADIARGGTYYTVYFVSGMLSGISLGVFLGSTVIRSIKTNVY